VQFAPGVNGIVGPNGSGKTHIVQAIEFAMTGNWPGYGPKEMQISWGEEKGSVELCFIDPEGTECVVSRSLHNSSSGLKVGKEKTSGFDKVNQKLALILGANAKVMSNFVFVPQKQIDRTLLCRPCRAGRLLFGSVRYGQVRADPQTAPARAGRVRHRWV
jgi:DNA repair exonuclease SbcCD ATPase subunit